MKHPLVQAFEKPRPCPCACFENLSLTDRTEGIRALFRFDDAMRGWNYEPIYEPKAHQLWRQAQARNDPNYRGVAVRDHACLFRRLLGFAVHEVIHALMGTTTEANYGIPFGIPYGVPLSVPENYASETAYLDAFNFQEAVAFTGVEQVASALFGVDWAIYTAREVGTYGFVGGRAVVNVPSGFRPVLHFDYAYDPEPYLVRARTLESKARAWLDEKTLPAFVERFELAEALGKAKRKASWPDPQKLAVIAPKIPERNELCPCGSGKKAKLCCF